ncbi:hypothetical protein FOZ61_005538 [Perkinsus olseni]|uniref:Uncharacterized protein n=1 Tax=Perkinsus olseni TaxID=32597 RepID=A0A7J6LU20_PEROL|nr:hypothetical protein FOZ61_005538 [Perkinsus olseni]KAF4662812.1 hypothetical protein FOL46_005124 [Perkinsus olseni]
MPSSSSRGSSSSSLDTTPGRLCMLSPPTYTISDKRGTNAGSSSSSSRSMGASSSRSLRQLPPHYSIASRVERRLKLDKIDSVQEDSEADRNGRRRSATAVGRNEERIAKISICAITFTPDGSRLSEASVAVTVSSLMVATVHSSSSAAEGAAEKSSKWQQFLSSQTSNDTGEGFSRDNAAVLIMGVPGCGKRTLLKSIASDLERQLNRIRNPVFHHGNPSRAPKNPGSSMSRVSTGCQGNNDVKNRAASTNVVSKNDESLLAASMAAQAAIAKGVPRMAPIDFGYMPAVVLGDENNNVCVELGTLSLFYCEHPQHHQLISRQSLESFIAHSRFAAVVCLDMMHPERVIPNFESHLETIAQ